MGLLAVGQAGRDPLEFFLADQLITNRDEGITEKVQDRTDMWGRILPFVGGIVSAVCLAKASWSNTFLIPVIVMVAAYFVFLLGICFGSYYCGNRIRSPVTIVYEVLKAAITKRHLDYPGTSKGYFKNERNEVKFSPHHPILR